MRVFAIIEISLFAKADSRLALLVLFKSWNVVERIAAK